MKNRKVVFTEPWKVELIKDYFKDEIQNPSEVICRNLYSLISPATELACLSGKESWFQLPNTPGYMSAGEIIKKGEAVKDVKVGDIVFTYGSHSEYYKIDTNDRFMGMCLKVPSDFPLHFVPFTRMVSVAATALRISKIELGDFVAVTGLGLVGNFAAQLAKLQGGFVVGIDINSKRLEITEKCRIEKTINSSQAGWKEKIKDFTSGEGISTLIDATGLSKVIVDSLSVLKTYGEVILLGSPRNPFETNVTEVFSSVQYPHKGSVTFKGASEWRFPSYETEFSKHSIERNSKIIMQLIKKNNLKIDPLITHKISPDEAAKAYDGLRNHPDEYLGVIFDWAK
jgi:2-desacetyl-2-hydroxyethyl bacteriochlorophyllide A dehydrogenase